MVHPVFLGVDVGSTTVKVVVLDDARHLLAWRYVRSRGRPRTVVLDTVHELAREFDLSSIGSVGFSGSGGGPLADIVGGQHVNELVAQTRAVGVFHPEARTIIEIGGQDSKLLSTNWDEGSQQMMLEDFSMNALCAAGTGAFLDQQAERLGIQIDGDFAAIALTSTTPARIAGRCTVFAKSDMIHLQQVGTPMGDILMGVCLAMARNFTTVIGKGKKFVPPLLFQGGVAYNGAVKRAFETVLGLPQGSIIVPEHHTIMAALGTAYVAMDDYARGVPSTFLGFEALSEAAQSGSRERVSLAVLEPVPQVLQASGDSLLAALPEGETVDAWLGVDVGSVSTNVVLIDDANRLLARRYLMTAGRPLEAVREGLRLVAEDAAGRVLVRGVGSTGSGRYLTGDFIGADVVRNEITAQARAAAAIDPSVDTVIEIGGQDSKFIRLQNGAVTDFTMNNACAAGTGSFLQEQADRLKIHIESEFSDLAFSSGCPAALGERCTVFMESDLVHHQQRGAKVPDLTAGLAYSIAENYLNRVVNGRSLGSRVFFQGGVASNGSVVSAFATLTRRQIVVPPNHDVTGAIGAAILAREDLARRATRGEPNTTRFRGFDLSQRGYESSVFECRACPNICEVHKIVIDGESPIFYGARCDKFEEAGRGISSAWHAIPDLFAERERVLIGNWTDPGPRTPTSRTRVGILRNLTFFDFFPFWRGFLEELGCDIVLSAPTNPDIVKRTQATAAAESCFPVKLAFGHMADVVSRDIDVLLVPSILNREHPTPGQPHNHYCPLITATPYLLASSLPPDGNPPRIVNRALHLANDRAAKAELRQLADDLTGASPDLADRAAAAGWAALRAFSDSVRARGRAVLSLLGPDSPPAAVVIGRPYSANDPGSNLDLPYKLRRLGVLPIPMDFLPLGDVDLPGIHDDMFWRSGQDILRAGVFIGKDPRLQAIYLTNFNCGPDAFLITFFRHALGGKAFLELEVDDHTADAGMITRCEAFFDSLNLRRIA